MTDIDPMEDLLCELPGCKRLAYIDENSVYSSPELCAYHLYTMDDE